MLCTALDSISSQVARSTAMVTLLLARLHLKGILTDEEVADIFEKMPARAIAEELANAG